MEIQTVRFTEEMLQTEEYYRSTQVCRDEILWCNLGREAKFDDSSFRPVLRLFVFGIDDGTMQLWNAIPGSEEIIYTFYGYAHVVIVLISLGHTDDVSRVLLMLRYVAKTVGFGSFIIP